jgi:hypothetical protein
MIYAHVYQGTMLFARASNLLEARMIFVRSIRATMRATMNNADTVQRELITYAINSFKVARESVFIYAPDSCSDIIGSSAIYDTAANSQDTKPDSFIKLKAYQKPSKRDWSYIPQKRETLHYSL